MWNHLILPTLTFSLSHTDITLVTHWWESWPTNPTSLLKRVFPSHLTKPSFSFHNHDMILLARSCTYYNWGFCGPLEFKWGVFFYHFLSVQLSSFLGVFFFFFSNGFSLYPYYFITGLEINYSSPCFSIPAFY